MDLVIFPGMVSNMNKHVYTMKTCTLVFVVEIADVAYPHARNFGRDLVTTEYSKKSGSQRVVHKKCT